MPVPTSIGNLGIAKETVKGTPVSPTSWIPIPKSRVWQDMLMQLDDVGLRGVPFDGPYDQIPGPLYSTFDIPDGAAFPDTMPWWVFGILCDVTSLASRSVADGVTIGTTTVTSATAAFTQNDVGRPVSGTDIPAGAFIVSVTNATTIVISAAATGSHVANTLVTGAASLNSHVGAAKNSGDIQATAYTLTDFYGLTGTHTSQFPGCQVAEVNLKFTGDGLLTIAAKLTGLTRALVAKPSQSFTTVVPHAGWENFVTIAGVSTGILVSGELNLKRPTNPIHTADGSQAPYAIWQGGLAVDGKLVVVAEDDAEYLRYLNSTKPAVTFEFRKGTPGAGYLASKFQMSKCNYTGASFHHDQDYARIEANFQALWNTTDVGASGGASPVKATFQNAVAASTYQ